MSERIPIRRAESSDAEAVVQCFERCYAGTYPADAFQNAAEMAALIESELLRSVVAVTSEGEVVGHMGLRMRAPDAITAVAGNSVVDPRYRGHHLAGHLGLALMKLAVDTGLVGTHGYPTTAHPVLQKLEVAGGGFETGVLFDYIPAETQYVDIEARAGRLAVVAIYRPLSAAPSRRLFLPAAHDEIIRAIHSRIKLERDFVTSNESPPPGATRMTSALEERRGVLRIEVESVGAELGDRIAGEIKRQPASLALVDLPFEDPTIGAAVEALRPYGFFFGAILPESTARGDVLRLQRPAAEPTAPELATEAARELLAYVTRDRTRCT
jgi:hypothetical protein